MFGGAGERTLAPQLEEVRLIVGANGPGAFDPLHVHHCLSLNSAFDNFIGEAHLVAFGFLDLGGGKHDTLESLLLFLESALHTDVP